MTITRMVIEEQSGPTGQRQLKERQAEFWRETAGNRVICDLCYRQCELSDGAAGFCKIRVNRNGKLALTAHGILAQYLRDQNGYNANSFMTFKPGAKDVMLGGLSCSARCGFCISTTATLRPEALPWFPLYENRLLPNGSVWRWNRGMYTPMQAVYNAQQWGAKQITFAINEPTLTYEYTLDTARLAKRMGLDVAIQTNGFSSVEAIKRLAPFVDAVNIGIKASTDPDFYKRYISADGATVHILASARAWHEAGVYVMVSDVIGAPHLQADAAAEESQNSLYHWIARELGPLTPVMLTPMGSPQTVENINNAAMTMFLLQQGATDDDIAKVIARIKRAWQIAQSSGLPYSWMKTLGTEIKCHQCGASLLRFNQPMGGCNPCDLVTKYCTKRTHEQHVTKDSKCENCGVPVPIIV